MNGKDKCRLLKEIREEIARENNIEFESEECTFEGDCSGTCPKCEEELRYLEREIDKKEGKITRLEEPFNQGEIHVRFKKDTDEIDELDVIEPLEGLPVAEHEFLIDEPMGGKPAYRESDDVQTIHATEGVPADNEILGLKRGIYKLRKMRKKQ